MKKSWLVFVVLISCGRPNPNAGTQPLPVPATVCTSPIQAVNTSVPNQVVGNGTAASCTEAALRTALGAGGIITFSCGANPITIPISSELVIPMNSPDVVLDGRNLITLSGQNQTRILNINSSFERNTPNVTIQKMGFTNANRSNDGGGAIKRLGATLQVIDSVFTNNTCIPVDQDKAGGAIYSVGPAATTIVGSRFQNNACASGGAIGGLFAEINIYNSNISQNTATGNGGNPGNGGNGGGIYVDGNDNSLKICGSIISNNTGAAFGGGVFKVINNLTGTTTIEQSTIADNTSTGAKLGGGLYLQGTAATINASTISGNSADGAGGIYIGPGSSLNMYNSTIASNTAVSSLGGGLFLDGVTGSIRHTTFAENAASGASAFGGAVAGDGSNITLQNSIFSKNIAGNGFNPITCSGQKFINGGGNSQFPINRTGGGSDNPSALCTTGISTTDPLLGTLSNNGGPTKTILPNPNSPIKKTISSNCASTDQRGQPRATPCSAGATEP